MDAPLEIIPLQAPLRSPHSEGVDELLRWHEELESYRRKVGAIRDAFKRPTRKVAPTRTIQTLEVAFQVFPVRAQEEQDRRLERRSVNK